MFSKFFLPAAAVLCGLIFAHETASAQGTAFSYQGQLNSAGRPANGLYGFEFALFDAPTNGNQIGPAIFDKNVVVNNGLFSLILDFGLGAFTGQPVWMQIGVANDESSGFTVLSPLQPLTAVPYVIYATTAGTAVNVSGNGGNLTNLQASQIVGTLFVGWATNSETTVLASNLIPAAAITNAQLVTPSLFSGAPVNSPALIITNGLFNQSTGYRSNDLVAVFNSGASTNFTWLEWVGPGGEFVQNIYWPDHDGPGDPEWANSSSGSIAFVPGIGGHQGAPYLPNRGLQIGNPDYRGYLYLNMDHTVTFGSPVGWSVPIIFRGPCYSNGDVNVIQPAWQLQNTDTNGNAALKLFDNVDTTIYPPYTNWAFYGATPRAQFRVTMNGSPTNAGFDVWGTFGATNWGWNNTTYAWLDTNAVVTHFATPAKYDASVIAARGLEVGPANGIGGSIITNGGIVWLSTNLPAGVPPNAVLPNGSICTTTNGAFYVRSNNVWVAR